MAHHDQFEGFKGAAFEDAAQRPDACIVCETMLPEAVDGTLSAAEQRIFDAHVAGCTACSQELSEAQRGAAWLGMLKNTPPEPPAHLLAKILAGTSEATESSLAFGSPRAVGVRTHVPEAGHGVPGYVVVPSYVPEMGRRTPGFAAGWAARVGGFGKSLSGMFSMEHAQSVFQPRMAMTAAMAFFSIALTLNLTGIHLGDLHAENFTPSGVRRTLADTEASLARTFQNNRSVYQVESRLNELDRDAAQPQEGRSGR